jgi:hypothetical protein
VSVTVKWQPCRGKSLNGQSKLLLALIGTRDSNELDESDLSFLRGIAAGDAEYTADIDVLIDAILRHGRIRVWGEY